MSALCELVVELLARTERPGRERAQGWSALEWWDRLIEDLTGTSLVLAIDNLEDLDDYPPAQRRDLSRALSRLVQRRTRARLALIAPVVIPDLLDPATSVFWTTQTVEPPLFRDVWQWIRRNRPVLVPYGRERLARYYSVLPSLEAWSELARVVTNDPLTELDAAVKEVGPPAPVAAGPSPMGAALGMEGAALPVDGDRAGPRSKHRKTLLIAAAGLHLIGKEAELAGAATALAASYEIGGRVVTKGTEDAAGSIAELLPLPSPFEERGTASISDSLHWLQQATAQHAHIVMLDFGTSAPSGALQTRLAATLRVGALVIAAGGNEGAPIWPAWYPEALAVGALRAGRGKSARYRLAPYAHWDPAARKPDLFAPESVAGTAFETLVPAKTIGSSIAALNATGAALLVWAADRTQSASDVRQVLLDTACPLDAKQPDGPRMLDAGAALSLVRTRLVRRALGDGALDRDALVAATGLRPELVDGALKDLGAAVVRLTTPTGPRFGLVGSSPP